MQKKHQRVILWSLAIVVTFPLCALLAVWTLGGKLVGSWSREISKNEALLQKPEVFESVAITLDRYCQTDLKLLPERLDADWLPRELTAVDSGWAHIGKDHARLEMGGGPYHYGYSLELDKAASAAANNVWHLSLYRDEKTSIPLKSFLLPKTDSIPWQEIFKRRFSLVTEKLRKDPESQAAHRNKIQLLLAFDQVEDARIACREMFKAVPDSWWSSLTNALLVAEVESFPRAEQLLSKDITEEPTFNGYLRLAYFYQLHTRPEKAAEAIDRAISMVINVAPENRAQPSLSHAYVVSLFAYRTRQYDSAIKLCECVLPRAKAKQELEPEFQELLNASKDSKQGVVTKISRNMGTYDPYHGFELSKLIGRKLFDPKQAK